MPGVWLFYRAVQNQLGPDPVKVLENGLGEYALQFLIAGLAISPLMRFAKINLIKYRRALGLIGFFYVVAHFTVYIVLDMQFNWQEIITDIIKRPYITIGVSAFLLLLPLALTSNNLSIRKLGAAGWNKLHLIKKTWALEPLIYLATALLLISLRRFYHLAKRKKRVAA